VAETIKTFRVRDVGTNARGGELHQPSGPIASDDPNDRQQFGTNCNQRSCGLITPVWRGHGGKPGHARHQRGATLKQGANALIARVIFVHVPTHHLLFLIRNPHFPRNVSRVRGCCNGGSSVSTMKRVENDELIQKHHQTGASV
jgi:hypothetical protein